MVPCLPSASRGARTMAFTLENFEEVLRRVVGATAAQTAQTVAQTVTAALQAERQARGKGGHDHPVPGEGARRQRTLMEKDYRRVDKFDGVEKNWKTFEFDFRIATKAVSSKVVAAMDQSAIEEQVVTGADFEKLDGVNYEGMRERGLELFEILCGLTCGSAKLMIREAPENDGFAAWQILQKTYGRKTLANSLKKYREAVCPKQAKDTADIVGVIAKWENAVKELERTEQEAVPNVVKLAALTRFAPAKSAT